MTALGSLPSPAGGGGLRAPGRQATDELHVWLLARLLIAVVGVPVMRFRYPRRWLVASCCRYVQRRLGLPADGIPGHQTFRACRALRLVAELGGAA